MISSIVTLLFLSSAHGISLVKIPPDINPTSKYVELHPRHVHLALGRLPNSLVWTWSTRDATPHPTLLLTLVIQKQLEVSYNGTSVQEVAYNGTSVQEVAYNGTNSDQEVAHNGTSSDQEVAYNGTSRDQEVAYNGTSSVQEVAYNGTTSVQEVAYNGTTSVQEVAYNGTSSDQEVAYNGTSRDHEVAYNGTSRDQEVSYNGTTSDQEVAYNGTSRDQEVAYNGTSRDQEVSYNGTTSDQEVAYNGTTRIFVDGGNERRSQWIHRVEVTGLQANAKYSYIVGSSLGWSDVFHTTTAPKGNNWSLRLALYGDLGNENAISLPMIQREVDDGKYDGILHVGDFAYDMDSDNARTGDAFMEQIEPIASLVPYMTCPGNHEWRYNFSNYKARFNMPRDGSNMYYSFNMGPVHFVSVSTEFYYYINYGIKMLINQYHWLQQDLAKANTPEARANQPWIVIFGHRPMYCSTTDEDDCDSGHARTRVGMPVLHWWGMEDIMYKHGVDLAVWAHEHNYERLWPTYDMKVLNGTAGPYVDPPAPVHVTTGSPGCKERHDNFQPVAPEWTAFRSKDYGYTRLYVHNATHVNIQQVSADQGGKVIDDFWILKSKHGSYN